MTKLKFRGSTSREFEEDLSGEAKKYAGLYLHKNKLGMYLDGYKKLDDIINLFFLNYAKLDRSSLNCARLWVAVMKCRTQMTNAITHLVDQQRYISVEYKELRMQELYNHISSCRIFVAKAVQYLVTFTKHKEEEWRFLRKGFLENWSVNLSNALFAETEKWCDFIITAFELRDETAKAYRQHLKNQEMVCREALKEVEPKSKIAQNNGKLGASLMKAYQMRNSPKVKENDYYSLRVQLSAVADCLGLEKFIAETSSEEDDNNVSFNNSESEGGDAETVETVKAFLKKEIPQIVADDDAIWPHQMGLEDLGPFQLVDLKEPLKYLDVGDDSYSLKPAFARVDGLGAFHKKQGTCSKRGEVTFKETTLKALGIPTRSKFFKWFFPIYAEEGADLSRAFNHANDFSPLHVLALFGGFAYYDEKGELISVKGVTMGDDLFFDGPYFIPNESAYDELESQGVHFEEVTLGSILAKDAVSFAWVNKGQDEPFKVHLVGGGSQQKGWEFSGAFAYRYDNDKYNGKPVKDAETHEKLQKRRNYFQVLTFQEVSLKRQKNANTPVVASLRILYNKYRENWADKDEITHEMTTDWSSVVFQSTTGLEGNKNVRKLL